MPRIPDLSGHGASLRRKVGTLTTFDIVRDTFHATLETAREIAGQHQRPFRFKNLLVSIDATVIDLCCTVFDWARYQRTYSSPSNLEEQRLIE